MSDFVLSQKTRTHNTYTNSVTTDEKGRIQINLNVNKFSTLNMNAIARLGFGTLANITLHLQARFSDTISQGDVKTNLRKLKKLNLVGTRGHGENTVYYLKKDALDKWRALNKVFV